MKDTGQKKTKRNLFIFGVGVLSFIILIVAASLTIGILYMLFNDKNFDAYGISFLALTAFALIVTVVTVVFLYHFVQQSQTLIDSLNRVASGDYSTEITYSRRSTFRKVYANFNNMTRELSSVKSIREEFVNNFSHEVKTPLFSIQGFANLLSEGGLTEEEQKKLLNIISEEAGRLIRLAENNLTLSKIENQHILEERKLLKLDSEIKDCVILMQNEWESKEIEIVLNLEPVKFTGDGGMLRHVWINLLSNAIKFTPEGGKIEVNLQKVGENAVIEFSDNGICIDDGDMPHIFEKYYRSKAAAGHEGSGLGLAICKRILELSGGGIKAENRKGGGATFTVTLPVD